jgi:hypothetical protein
VPTSGWQPLTLLCLLLWHVCASQGMKKRVGFQFNALEDTVESIGLEMVEQLALNAHQVGSCCCTRTHTPVSTQTL